MVLFALACRCRSLSFRIPLNINFCSSTPLILISSKSGRDDYALLLARGQSSLVIGFVSSAPSPEVEVRDGQRGDVYSLVHD
jgi:hypothetical protein